MRTLCSVLTFFILSGCDTLHGIRMPVSPPFERENWACAVGGMESEGYSLETDDTGQLSVAANGQYLFSAYPNRNGDMELYSYAFHRPPSCSDAQEAYRAMKALVRTLEQDCGYTAESHSVALECSSNNRVN
jgi:hypothetical protein